MTFTIYHLPKYEKFREKYGNLSSDELDKLVKHDYHTFVNMGKGLNGQYGKDGKPLDDTGGMLYHPNLSGDTIDYLVKKHTDGPYNPSNALTNHNNLQSGTIDTMFKMKHPYVQFDKLINHKNITISNLNTAFDNGNTYIASLAVTHDKADNNLLDKGVLDRVKEVALAALSNPKINQHNLKTALSSKHTDVRLAALKHPKASIEHFKIAANDKNKSIREFANSKLN